MDIRTDDSRVIPVLPEGATPTFSKVEELTLYTVEQETRIARLVAELQATR